MRFSVGYDLDSFFSGLGEEGRTFAQNIDYQHIPENAYA